MLLCVKKPIFSSNWPTEPPVKLTEGSAEPVRSKSAEGSAEPFGSVVHYKYYYRLLSKKVVKLFWRAYGNPWTFFYKNSVKSTYFLKDHDWLMQSFFHSVALVLKSSIVEKRGNYYCNFFTILSFTLNRRYVGRLSWKLSIPNNFHLLNWNWCFQTILQNNTKWLKVSKKKV